MIGKPKVLILDEPFANLDPTSQSRLKKTISDYHTEDNMILVSSHDLSHVAEVSTRIFIMESGKIIKDLPKTEDTMGELRAYFDV